MTENYGVCGTLGAIGDTVIALTASIGGRAVDTYVLKHIFRCVRIAELNASPIVNVLRLTRLNLDAIRKVSLLSQ